MILSVPAETPVTVPVPEPTDARAGLLLLHVPPEGEELSVVLPPTHTDDAPDMADGVASTVTGCVEKQPPESV